MIPGGSSSGSAVAVSAGLVPLALGTDTAGSGRVPAMLNNIVGLKPSLGLISNAGLVPACRTLDCISVFSLTVDDAMTALAAMAGPDGADPFSRDRPLGAVSAFPGKLRLGVPRNGQLIFFGDRAAEKAYGEALERWTSLGATLVEFDLEPFYETARLLYEGPWVAERYLVIRDLLASAPDSIHPVTREITAAGARLTAADTFASLYRLQALRRVAERAFANFDAMVLPTAPTAYSTAQVLANPIELNSRLGTYTNFVNLLDLCGLALPAAMRADGIPFGITLLAPAGHDASARQHRAGVSCRHQTEDGSQGPDAARARCIAGCGRQRRNHHRRGRRASLRHGAQRRTAGARRDACSRRPRPRRTTSSMRSTPRRRSPACCAWTQARDSSIKLELWALSAAAFGKFVAAIPPPLGIGTIRLADGTRREGFCGRARGDRRRARYFVVRRLARVHGGEGGE